MDDNNDDICRVCRSEGSSDRPLFHPCICTGSIRYIHQECLVQWLKHSKKEYCELCMHRFAFTPIYSPDMPSRLPVTEIARGLIKNMGTAIKCWLHYSLVTFAWLGIVPITACRIYRCLFQASLVPLLALPFDVFSLETMVTDILQGCFVVGCTLCAFISLVWLREQVLHGGGPEWLEDDQRAAVDRVVEQAMEGNLAPEPGEQQVNNAQQPQQENNAGAAAAEPGGGGGDQPQNADAEAQPANQQAGDVAPPGDRPENAAAAGGNNAAGEENAGQEDINWNGLEWDRAADELTWERMLGLDGSLVFLEHVLWVISLNALFVFLFAFCPYHIGGFGVVVFGWADHFKASRFEGLVTTMFGYYTLASCLILFHAVTSLLRLNKTRRLLGLCYIVLKVFLLVVLEIGVFPLICGWWLDICSLTMFDVTLQDRLASFHSAPGTAMFLHWLVGMVYVFYFASFILLLREVLRPGVLWFLRNLNDPDFNPIQEMIHLPIYRHVRRFLLSIIVFGSVVLLMLWMPVTATRYVFPNFLPYHIHLSSDAPVSELSLELLLLQVVLPALLEQGHTRQWLKNFIKCWTMGAAAILDLKSYLLGDEPVAADAAMAPARLIVPDAANPAANEGNENEAPAPEGDAAENNQAEDNVVVEAMHSDSEDDSEFDLEYTPANSDDEDAYDAEDFIAGARQLFFPHIGNVANHAQDDDSDVVMEDEEDTDEEEFSGDEEDSGEEGAEAEQPAAEGVPPVENPPVLGGGLQAAHQALLNQVGPTGFQPYTKPNLFPLRICLLVLLLCLSLLAASLLCLTIPVAVGRLVMSLWMGNQVVIHELYTAACGLYLCWLVCRLITVLVSWGPQGRELIVEKVKEYTMLAVKSIVVAVMLLGLIPLLLGLLFELVVVVPLRVPLDQSPVFFPWQDWALGVLHAKIICAITMMGPTWWLKTVLEQVYQDGFRNLNLTYITRHMAVPVCSTLLFALTCPYFIAAGIIPVLGLGEDVDLLVQRRIYPVTVTIIVCAVAVIFQVKQCKRLYEHIKNDKYLVGQQLVNYEPRDRDTRDNATQTAAEH
ncbi:LOW QUALITY PROTEIN: E3 ubiquitin-protein ligase MARCHF6-like [Amphiura filiformis]|uniref:LOW QUALITY PROTEIN: E3 ubiquitin-protein ligase MARCHF6-like n=1 Tax=Amphiura filiformis TaxID=82378 RepID=UPI003B21E0BA